MPRVKLDEPAWAAKLGEPVATLAWNATGDRLAALTTEGQLVVMDENGTLIEQAPAHDGGAFDIAWHGDIIATSGADGAARLWSRDAKLVVALDAGSAWVEHLAWSARGELATAAGRVVKTWSQEGKPIETFTPAKNTIAALAWNPQAPEQLASTGYGGVTVHKPAREFEWKGSMLSLEWAPDARHVACGCQDASVHVWNVKSGKDMQMTGYPTKVTRLSWSRDARYLATTGAPQCTIWDFSGKGPQGSTPIVLDGHEQNLSDVAFQRTGDLLVTSGHDGRALLWDTSKPDEPRLVLRDSGAAISRVAWRGDDALLAIADEAGHVSVHATAPRRAPKLPAHRRRAK